jgi:uncharacterized protein YqeY
MALRERLVEEMKSAMKAKEGLRLSVIRMVRSAVKNKEIELKKELDDQEIIEIITTLVKQRRESIKLFQEAGRNELVLKEETELGILLDFLPKQLERHEICEIVAKAITDCGAQGVRDMGKIMKIIIPHVSGRADGKVVNEIVKQKLS